MQDFYKFEFVFSNYRQFQLSKTTKNTLFKFDTFKLYQTIQDSSLKI